MRLPTAFTIVGISPHVKQHTQRARRAGLSPNTRVLTFGIVVEVTIGECCIWSTIAFTTTTTCITTTITTRDATAGVSLQSPLPFPSYVSSYSYVQHAGLSPTMRVCAMTERR